MPFLWFDDEPLLPSSDKLECVLSGAVLGGGLKANSEPTFSPSRRGRSENISSQLGTLGELEVALEREFWGIFSDEAASSLPSLESEENTASHQTVVRSFLTIHTLTLLLSPSLSPFSSLSDLVGKESLPSEFSPPELSFCTVSTLLYSRELNLAVLLFAVTPSPFTSSTSPLLFEGGKSLALKRLTLRARLFELASRLESEPSLED
mmetsp:Transcript_22649/g.47048  ORF Transcript_22649/g.47048 Transcript_22649/m.47048 type:complete len:207 (-) Transcript_22649:852-1472(-)